MCTYIVFGEDSAGTLINSFGDSGGNNEANVITVSDFFSIGPVKGLTEKVGLQNRYVWLSEHINHSPFDYFEDDYLAKFENALKQIYSVPAQTPIIVLCGENAHEQTGVRYVLHLLQGRTNNIHVINTTVAYKMHFDRPDLQHFILHTGEISPKEIKLIVENSKLNLPLKNHEIDRLVQEWNILNHSEEELRIWIDGQINSVATDYFDNFIINAAQQIQNKQKDKGFIKAARVIGYVLGDLDQYVGDQFLEYRLRYLIENGVFDVDGSLESMRYYSVRLREKR